MTDTATRTMKPRDVQYGLKVVDELPESAFVQRRSPIEDALDEIIAHPEAHGKWVQVASYGNGGAASSQSNELRKRHGYKPSFQGWSFATARADDENGNPRTGLFVKYNADAKTSTGAQEQKDETARRQAKAKTRKPRSKKAAAA